jgi:molecular chaperone IbpA
MAHNPMRSFLDPLTRGGIGFDFERIQQLAEQALASAENYPPYNIERTGENAFCVTLAVAGFEASELTAESEGGKLVVTGTTAQDTKPEDRFLHRGIARRAFRREFSLADHVEVTGASLANGLLNVELRKNIPEEHKPRRIEISA